MKLSDLGHLFLDGIGPIETRSATGNEVMDQQLAALRRRYESARPWRVADVEEAMGVPAIFGAVSLIADTVGSLSLEAFRNGSLLPQDRTPRIVQRPNPFTPPRDFFRDTAYYLATRGEAWWWIASRDIDGVAESLYPVPPWEIVVEQNDGNRLRPTIKWGNTTIPNENIRQITYMPGRDGRGKGPLQECGAAVSVTVESQEWAANFFSGSIPSIIGTTEQDMTEDELAALDKQWNEKPPNTPRWLTNGLKLSESPMDPQRADLSGSRLHQIGDTARMFNMPGSLIEYQMSGSSLRYQNDETVWADFQRRCLSPHYLEPIEQHLSDLLTRSTVARFNLEQLLRASIKTRAEVHKTMIEAGVYDARYAAQKEGIEAGNVDYAPVPQSPPSSVPNILPINRARSLEDLHCPKCGRMAGRVAGPAEIQCKRCGSMVVAA